MKSRTDLPNTHIAGDKPVSLSGVFLYCNNALWNLSVSRLPAGPVFSMISLFTVFTAISARELLWGKYAEDILCFTPQFLRKRLVSRDVNSEPPSEDSSSLMPKVTKARLNAVIRPWLPLADLSTIGQLEYLSTATR